MASIFIHTIPLSTDNNYHANNDSDDNNDVPHSMSKMHLFLSQPKYQLLNVSYFPLDNTVTSLFDTLDIYFIACNN